MTRRDDDFLKRTEPFSEPRGGGLEHGSAGYAEGARHSRAERRPSRHNERRAATSKVLVLGAGLMGAAVVAAAAFTVLVFAGLFTVSSGVVGGHHPVTLVQQPPLPPHPLPRPLMRRIRPGPATRQGRSRPAPPLRPGVRPCRLPIASRSRAQRRARKFLRAAIDIERFGAIVLSVVALSERRACPGHADDIGTGHEPSGARAFRTQQVGRSRVSRVKHDRRRHTLPALEWRCSPVVRAAFWRDLLYCDATRNGSSVSAGYYSVAASFADCQSVSKVPKCAGL